jgi:hypothetical protein
VRRQESAGHFNTRAPSFPYGARREVVEEAGTIACRVWKQQSVQVSYLLKYSVRTGLPCVSTRALSINRQEQNSLRTEKISDQTQDRRIALIRLNLSPGSRGILFFSVNNNPPSSYSHSISHRPPSSWTQEEPRTAINSFFSNPRSFNLPSGHYPRPRQTLQNSHSKTPCFAPLTCPFPSRHCSFTHTSSIQVVFISYISQPHCSNSSYSHRRRGFITSLHLALPAKADHSSSSTLLYLLAFG